MKLNNFTYIKDYRFMLFFENGEKKEVDLSGLIKKHVDMQNIKSAEINREWGCLEFKGGMVDIDPKTLYRHAMQAE